MRRTTQLILALYTISFLLHAYVGTRLVPALPDVAGLPWIALFLLASSALLIPAAMIQSRRDHTWVNTLIVWSGLVLMGLFSSWLVFTLVRDALMGLIWVVQPLLGDAWLSLPWLNQEWRSASALTVLVAGLLMSVVGFTNIWFGPRVIKVKVPIEHLPAELADLRLVQLTDVHIGPTIKRRFLRKVVKRVNRLQPDAVVITGDLVDGPVEQLGEEITPLSDLASKHGTFFVTGNHEYYSRAHGWLDRLRQLGVRVLMNEHVVLHQQQQPWVMAGITDYSAHQFDDTHRSDPAKAFEQAPHALRVLLAHQPRSILNTQHTPFDLQLSGHTHGGQFWPWNYFVPLQQPFTHGLHRYDGKWIYVSRGTGYWGPPKRFGAPAEITLIQFVRAATS